MPSTNHLAPHITTTTVPSPGPQAIPPSSIEAKLVILGAQGVGKTSLVSRFINPNLPLSHNVQSTIGASFVTKRIIDHDTATVVRLQIWDTAGQERFRSISRLYYRGANAGLLCYDITNEKSWEEMKGWLQEMKENCCNATDGTEGPIIHVVGTKSDLVAHDPSKREVSFERTIAYVAENIAGVTLLNKSQTSTPPLPSKSVGGNLNVHHDIQSPDSKRSSGFWNQDFGWDSCHEVNATDGEGIEEVFRVIARKLVEQRNKKEAAEYNRLSQTPGGPMGNSTGGDDYFNGSHGHQTGSFRLGPGDKRRSWLGLPSVGLGIGDGSDANRDAGTNFGAGDSDEMKRQGRCC